jgi:hypothetical protein
MDPRKFIDYANQVSQELGLLADAGHCQYVEIEGEHFTAIVAVGPEEAALLRGIIAKLKDDPELAAYREKKLPAVEANVVGALAPERN